MSTIKFKMSPDIVRKANNRLMAKGVSNVVKFHGGLVAKYSINGIEKVREISKTDVKEAYAKSLAEYATKL